MEGRPVKRARAGKPDGVGVGAIVKVSDARRHFPNYRFMATVLRLTKWQSRNESQGVGVDYVSQYVELEDGDIGYVVGVQQDSLEASLFVAGIHVPKRNHEYLIDAECLKVLCSQPAASASIPAALMSNMWASRASTGDVRLISSSGEALPAHASVLSACSPVFAAAFTAGMHETTAREMRLPDTETDVVDGVLRMLYLGALPDALDRMAILAFAHKYSIVEAVKPIVNDLVMAIGADGGHEVLRMARDFDDRGVDVVGKAFDVWGGDRDVMRMLLRHV